MKNSTFKYTDIALKNVLLSVLSGEDHRKEVLAAINSSFLEFALDFFKKVAIAKIERKDITSDWYKDIFLDENRVKEDIAIYSGLNMKTITNTYNTGRKEVVIDAANAHLDTLRNSIEELTDVDPSMELNISIKMNQTSVELTLSESLIVINALAVKRMAISGGGWSAIGKRIEYPLMKALCTLYGVREDHYHANYKKADYTVNDTAFSREVDFYLINNKNEELLCEVKLMGKGNPEVADAVYARGTKIFVADTLSETVRRSLNSSNISWVELSNNKNFEAFKQFEEVLIYHDIPYDKNTVVTKEKIYDLVNSEEAFLK